MQMYQCFKVYFYAFEKKDEDWGILDMYFSVLYWIFPPQCTYFMVKSLAWMNIVYLILEQNFYFFITAVFKTMVGYDRQGELCKIH
jgi:hypothetical protein